MMHKPVVWTIAGSDPTSGAGVQTDLVVMQYMKVHACSVIVAMTAQNSHSVQAIEYVAPEMIAAQIAMLQGELMPQVIKLGMLGHVSTIELLVTYLNFNQCHVVLDPVLVSSSGINLFAGTVEEYIAALSKLFPYIDLITPNIAEAEKITGKKIQSYDDMVFAATSILAMGVKNVLIKGGHFDDAQFSQDYWTNGDEAFWLAHPRFRQKNYRGTGCALASAIAACLALNYSMQDALVVAKMYINRGMRLNLNASFLFHGGWPEGSEDIPFLSHVSLRQCPAPFPECLPASLGLYPIVDSYAWLQKLLPTGVKTIQLRIKNKQGYELENEIKKSIQLAQRFDCQLFINDHWELAIAHGAYGVHLGQEDLNYVDIEKIRDARLRLGISTHCYSEIARAHAYKPSYIACGPIFATTSKQMAFAPQGIANLKRCRNTLKDYPLVAIGGINETNIDDVYACGVDGVAMISAITKAKDPVAKTRELVHDFVHSL